MTALDELRAKSPLGVPYTTTELLELGIHPHCDLLEGDGQIADSGRDVLEGEVGLLGVGAVNRNVCALKGLVCSSDCFRVVHVSPSVGAVSDTASPTVGDATGLTGSPSGEPVAPHLNGSNR